jgi:hypothetical protein
VWWQKFKILSITVGSVDDEALFGKLQNDFKADDLARKLGLMVDEYGVVYGFDGQSFL